MDQLPSCGIAKTIKMSSISVDHLRFSVHPMGTYYMPPLMLKRGSRILNVIIAMRLREFHLIYFDIGLTGEGETIKCVVRQS
jgi:hypothetical protein